MVENETVLDKKKKEELDRVLSELKSKIGEFEKLKDELEKHTKSKITPQKTQAMLEEITVPSLEVISEKAEKKKKGK